MSIRDIFPARITKEHIKFIQHKEWNIYYSCMNRYPYLVVEYLDYHILKQQENINRQSIEDPFRPDPALSSVCQLTLPIYDNLKRYGLSPGHNAPAGTHLSNPSTWADTFLFSNMTPQEITFNAGTWVVLENWVKRLIRNPQLSRVRCITGSPAASKNSQRNRKVWDPNTKRMTLVHVPSQMFKIVLAQPRYKPKQSDIPPPVYIACFLYPNRPVLPTPETWNLHKYRVMLPDIERVTGYKLSPLIDKLFNLRDQSPASQRLQSLETVVSLDFQLSPGLLIQMERAKYYYHLAYAKTQTELDKVWEDFMKNKDRLQITELKHHAAYRDATAAKLKDSSKQIRYLDSKNKRRSNKSTNKNSTKQKHIIKNNSKTKKRAI